MEPTDKYPELRRHIPRLEEWIDGYIARPGRRFHSVASLGFLRLPEYFPASFLEKAQVAEVERIELPPVEEMGPNFLEFKAVAATLGGGTFKNRSFVVSEAWHAEASFFHELIHQLQWAEAGSESYLLTYAVELERNGYRGLSFEAMAYDLEGRFVKGEPIVGLEGYVRRKTREAVDACLR